MEALPPQHPPGRCGDTPHSSALRLLTPAMLQKYDINDILTAYGIGLAGLDFFDALAEACATGRMNRTDRPAMQAELKPSKRKAK